MQVAQLSKAGGATTIILMHDYTTIYKYYTMQQLYY